MKGSREIIIENIREIAQIGIIGTIVHFLLHNEPCLLTGSSDDSVPYASVVEKVWLVLDLSYLASTTFMSEFPNGGPSISPTLTTFDAIIYINDHIRFARVLFGAYCLQLIPENKFHLICFY